MSRKPTIASVVILAATSAATAAVCVPAARGSGQRAAVIGSLRVRMAALTVDSARGTVFGVSLHQVLALNEASGKVSPVAQVGNGQFLWYTAVDEANGHLLTGVLSYDKGYPPNPRSPAGGTRTLADVIDPYKHMVMATVVVSRAQNDSFASVPEVTGVDGTLHHGFVVDALGRGVMVNTNTGALLARFRIGVYPGSYLAERNDAVLDEATHRLFVGLFGQACTSSLCRAHTRTDEVSVVNTTTGKRIRNVRGPDAPVESIALAERDQRVFLVGAAGHCCMASLGARTGFPVYGTRVGVWVFDVAADDRTGRAFVPALRTYGNRRLQMVTLDSRTGRVLHRVRLGPRTGSGAFVWGSLHSGVDRTSGRLFVGSDGVTAVWVFDALTGRLVRTIHLAKNVTESMAVDENTHRVFVSGPAGVMALDSQVPE